MFSERNEKEYLEEGVHKNIPKKADGMEMHTLRKGDYLVHLEFAEDSSGMGEQVRLLLRDKIIEEKKESLQMLRKALLSSHQKGNEKEEEKK